MLKQQLSVESVTFCLPCPTLQWKIECQMMAGQGGKFPSQTFWGWKWKLRRVGNMQRRASKSVPSCLLVGSEAEPRHAERTEFPHQSPCPKFPGMRKWGRTKAISLSIGRVWCAWLHVGPGRSDCWHPWLTTPEILSHSCSSKDKTTEKKEQNSN